MTDIRQLLEDSVKDAYQRQGGTDFSASAEARDRVRVRSCLPWPQWEQRGYPFPLWAEVQNESLLPTFLDSVRNVS